MKTFKQLGVKDQFIKALTEINIDVPTEIQERAIPFLIEFGTDFIGQAQTGTGKTAAFGLPLLQRMDTNDSRIQALVLSPILILETSSKLSLVKNFCVGTISLILTHSIGFC